MVEIIESNDYEKLSIFFHENGLEIKPGIKRPDTVIKCWECKDSSTGKLLGAASLEMRKGEYVVADVAVEQDCREGKIGTRLMDVLEAEIASLGGENAWLVGKVPGFYKKLGWEIVSREAAPDISKCFTCDQFGKECKPEIMHKAIQREKTR